MEKEKIYTPPEFREMKKAKAWEGISDREEKEYRKVAKAIKEKKGDWLGRWLEKFSVEGDFWNKEKKGKIKNNDYL